jgi:predicted nucleotidyltransferase/uncharacterized protein (UPF0332 family)
MGNRKNKESEREKQEKREEKESEEGRGGEGEEKEEYYKKIAPLVNIEEIEKLKKEIDQGKAACEKFKEEILKKYPFISAIGMALPMANDVIEKNLEEPQLEALEKEKEREKKIFHVFVIVGDENVKELANLSIDAINIVKNIKPKLWLNFFAIKDLWQICFDSKYDFIEAIAMAIPIHDTGILGALRVATIHKMMVLGKFEKYVVSYVLAGSIIRGQATATSDVDVYVVIDDTDVKKMSRFELRERLMGIIYSYAAEANERANAKNKLSPQVYLLTEFWEAVKEAHPVIFTFIRDGVPLYDRGAFMPWKLLLKMGKIKPSPEAIEMFMNLGEKVVDNVKRKLNTLITEDVYWGVITPSQAMLMLYGIPPTTPRETVKLMREIFVEKEKLLEKKYVDILEHIVEIYKKFEHEEKIEISGKDIDVLLEQISSYIERLKKLAEELEERARNKAMEDLYSTSSSLFARLYGKKPMKEYLRLLEQDFVKKGIVGRLYFDSFKKFLDLKKSGKKISLKDFELLRKDVNELIRGLREYAERKEVLERIKKSIKIKYFKDGKAHEGQIFFGKEIFLIPNIASNEVEKFDVASGSFVKSSIEELEESLKETQKEVKLSQRLIDALEKRFEKLEIIF